MKDERLYIDGELVDISSETKIMMDIKSNLFRDVSKIASNSTYTVKLPKTVRNQMILKHSDLVQSKEGFAYKMHVVRYFRNGVEVIKNGMATVLQVSNDAIELSIFWGLFPNFNVLLSSGITLNQLESTDKLLYQSKNVVDNYDDAVEKGYFYASYDVWKHENVVDYSWRGGQDMVYPEIAEGTYTAGIFGIIRTDGDNDNLHPVVKASWVLDLIKRTKGVDFQFKGKAKEYIDTLIIPLISKKSNELTFNESFKADLSPVTNKGAVPLTITEASNVFSGEAGNNITTLDVKIDANVIIDLKGEWQFDITGARPIGHSSWYLHGGNGSYDDYSFRHAYWLKMTVKTGLEVQEYIIGSDREHFLVSVPSGYQGIVKFQYTGYGKIEVKTGSTITFEWLSNSSLKAARFLGGSLKTTLQSDENVPNGGYFPIASNLPKIKVVDFIKFLAAITGTFPLQMSQDGIVQFVPLSTVWENKAEARDWTRRIIAQSAENKPRNIEFVMDDYGQHNLYKWKKDDTVVGNYDGDLKVSNDTLETERTIFEFPFAATNGNNVPMYTKNSSSGTSGGGGDYGGHHNDQTTPSAEDKKPSYSACKDRILRLMKDSKGKAIAWFDINMQQIIDEKYRNITDSLQKAKIVTEKVRIRDLELINFDETKPIYLAQYGSYFAVTEIKADETGLADVTMLQLYFN